MSETILRRAAVAVLALAAVGGTSLAGPATPALGGAALLAPAVSTMGPDTEKEARALQDAGRWDEAAEAWHGVVEAEPDNGEAWFNLGYCLHAGGHLEKAVKVHRKAAGFEQYAGIANYNLGCAYALMGQSDQALEALAVAQAAGFAVRRHGADDSDLESLRDDPRFMELMDREPAPRRGPMGGLGGMDIDLGDIEGLAQNFMGRFQRFMHERGPEIHEALSRLAMLAQEFLQELQEDEQLAPIAQAIQQALGRAMGGQSRSASAPEHEHEAHAEAHGEHAHAEGRAAEAKARAKADYAERAAAEIDVEAAMAKAAKLQRSREWLPAAKAFAVVAKARPDNSAAAFGLAYCLHMGGEYEKAIEAHRRATKFEDLAGIANFNLACAYALTGRAGSAFAALEAAHDAGFDVGDHLDDSDLDSLRDDPRFEKLRAKLRADL